MPRGNAALWRSVFSGVAVVLDVSMILLAAMVAGLGYHQYVFEETGPLETFLEMGAFVALMVIGGSAIRGEYSLLRYLDYASVGSRAVLLWNVAVLSAMAGVYLTKAMPDFSRATTLLFYPLGFVLLVGGRFLLVYGVRKATRDGRAPVRRVFLLGYEEEM